MKAIFIIALISFLFIVNGAFAAKTITLVTNGTIDSTCDELGMQGQLADSNFCSELSFRLGYNVKTIDEERVIENSPDWRSYAGSSDMVFVGNVSFRTANTSGDQVAFCNNLFSARANNPYLKYFFTPPSTNETVAGWELKGCAIFGGAFGGGETSLGGFTWKDFPPSNNTCPQKKFKILKSGYVTKDYSLGDTSIQFYSSLNNNVSIHNTNSVEDWVGIDCQPTGYVSSYYPVISTNKALNTSFWGLGGPQYYTSDAWNLFDGSVVYLLNDHLFNITARAFPQIPIKSTAFWVLAYATSRDGPVTGSDGFANFTIREGTIIRASGRMTYENGLWVNKTVNLSTDIWSSLVNVTFYSLNGEYRGSGIYYVGTGQNIVTITSPNTYIPNSNYLVSADFLNQPSGVSYNATSLTDLQPLSGGPFNYTDCGIYTKPYKCSKTVSIGDWGNSFILEVNSFPFDSRFRGGNFITVSKQLNAPSLTLVTNKQTYRPNENVRLDLYSNVPADEIPTLSLYEPDGTEIFKDIAMTQLNSTHWNMTYGLGVSAPNGDFMANVSFTSQGQVFTQQDTFSVNAWKLTVSTDKVAYNISDNVVISVASTEAYKSSLKIDSNLSITYPNSTQYLIKQKRLISNDSYSTTYDLPSNSPTGTYVVDVSTNDSDGRFVDQQTNFLVGTTVTPTQGLRATPSFWSVVTIEGRTSQKVFTITNIGTISASGFSVNIPSALNGIVTASSVPTFITSGTSSTLTLNIDTSSLSEDTYSGNVGILSSAGNTSVATTVTVVGNLSETANGLLSQLHSLLSNITALQQQGKDVTSIMQLYNATENLLNNAKSNFASGDYSSSLSKITQAEANINDIETQITGLQTGGGGADLGSVVWIFAGVVVIAIVGITGWKLRHAIKRLINRLLGKKEEEEVEEVYTRPEGEYRTEYY